MNPITKLLREQKHELAGIILGNEILGAVLGENSLEKLVGDWHTSSLTAIIRNEIDRKKGMQRDMMDIVDKNVHSPQEMRQAIGYNTALTEDITYWENVLEEIEKNV